MVTEPTPEIRQRWKLERWKLAGLSPEWVRDASEITWFHCTKHGGRVLIATEPVQQEVGE